jgi:hypothetical protein
MNRSTTIEEIRQRHEEVYGEILRDPSLARSGPRRDAFLSERVYPLLNDMKALPAGEMSVEDYAWLSDTAVQWQVVFSSIFGIPQTVEIASPRQLHPSTKRYTPGELEELLKRQSYFLSRSRKLEGLAEYIRHYRSTPAEMDQDWHSAKVVLAHLLLEGKINFARQISPESYFHTEEVWLEELRRVTAYFHWLAEGENLWAHDMDYHYASVHIREKLLDPRIKASRQDFAPVQDYLETHYLTDGQLDVTKPTTTDLVAGKAYRLWEKTLRDDSEENWSQATAYVKTFYEHIVPAVMENDPESITAVLNAFQAGAWPEYDTVVNCFEVIVAVHFLDPDILQKQFSERIESVF